MATENFVQQVCTSSRRLYSYVSHRLFLGVFCLERTPRMLFDYVPPKRSPYFEMRLNNEVLGNE